MHFDYKSSMVDMNRGTLLTFYALNTPASLVTFQLYKVSFSYLELGFPGREKGNGYISNTLHAFQILWCVSFVVWGSLHMRI